MRQLLLEMNKAMFEKNITIQKLSKDSQITLKRLQEILHDEEVPTWMELKILVQVLGLDIQVLLEKEVDEKEAEMIRQVIVISKSIPSERRKQFLDALSYLVEFFQKKE